MDCGSTEIKQVLVQLYWSYLAMFHSCQTKLGIFLILIQFASSIASKEKPMYVIIHLEKDKVTYPQNNMLRARWIRDYEHNWMIIYMFSTKD